MKKTFEVDNVRCGGCANTITKALEEEGYTDISVDLSCEPRKVTLKLPDEAQIAQIRKVLRKLGYPFSNEDIGFLDSTNLKAKSFVSCAVGKFSDTNEKN